MLKIMRKWAGASVFAAAWLFAMNTPSTQAGHGCSVSGGSYGISSYGGHGYQSHYSGGHTPYVSHYGGNHGGHWGGSYHDTTHLDYHAPSLVPHGNHYDYRPGHYDVHRTGHWHH